MSEILYRVSPHHQILLFLIVRVIVPTVFMQVLAIGGHVFYCHCFAAVSNATIHIQGTHHLNTEN